MDKIVKFTGLAAILDRANVDTDLIVPKQFLKRVERSGFGQFCFNNVRFLEDGSENPDWPLNAPRYKGARVLVGRENFGCGSSREHAPWALKDYGFSVIMAPSFANIFENNCAKNGILLIRLDNAAIDEWFRRIEAAPGYEITVDLPAQKVTGSDGFESSFEIDPHRKYMLMEGLDDISLTLKLEDRIAAYEKSHAAPWQAAVEA